MRRNGAGLNRRGQSGGGPRGLGGGGAPSELPFPALTNLRGRYRMDNVALTGSDITSMTDMSGIGNALPAVNPPALIVGPNGKPAAQFVEGSTEYMSLGAFSMGAAVAALTLLYVVRVDLATASRRWSQYTSQGVIVRHTAGGFIELLETGAGNATSTGTTDLRGGWFLAWAILTPGTDQSVGVGGTQEDSDVNTLAQPADGTAYTLGAGAAGVTPASISLAEHVVMRAAITAPELAAVRAYCLSRYGVS